MVTTFNLFKRKPRTIKSGEHISVTLYRGNNGYEAEKLEKYLRAYLDNKQLLPIKDVDGSDIYVNVEDVITDSEPDRHTKEMIYIVVLKGEISNG